MKNTLIQNFKKTKLINNYNNHTHGSNTTKPAGYEKI